MLEKHFFLMLIRRTLELAKKTFFFFQKKSESKILLNPGEEGETAEGGVACPGL